MEEEAKESSDLKGSKNEQVTAKEKQEPLQISVTENVIFCVDSAILLDCPNDNNLSEEIFDLLLLFINVKRKISIKPVGFQCLLFSKSRVKHVDVTEEKDLRSALMILKNLVDEVESDEFDLNLVFNSLAKMVELPHPSICSESIPAPCIYHCVLLFGRNKFVPVMKETNSFDFLIQSPFFAFDTVYLYNLSVEDNKCEMVANALYNLYESLNGYFFTVSQKDSDKQYEVFAQLLGHPLIRPPQNRSRFNLKELVAQDNVK